MTQALYLASASPRRRELLAQIGVHPSVIRVAVDETPKPGEPADQYVLRLAREKATAGHQAIDSAGDGIVLAADTAVVVDGEILGKPVDREDALQMMQRLSGRSHQVMTGVALHHGTCRCQISCSRVTFRDVSPAEAEAYWASQEPIDKAGGYAIQGIGALFISHLEGSFSGVMGLPLYETSQLLQQAGVALLAPQKTRDA